jgi:hypothetical protein
MGKLVDETESLNQRAALNELARLLAERIELAAATGAGTLAQESAQYRATMAEIKALPFADAPKGGGKVVSADEARLRREARRAGAEADAATGTGGRKRR